MKMNFSNLLTNWKTSLGGVLLIGIAGAQLLGVSIPGIPHVDFGTSIVELITGVMGLVAKDSTVTGGTTPNT
jgi:hypothetical protein